MPDQHPVDVKVRVTRHANRLTAPVAGLVKAVKRPSRADCKDVGILDYKPTMTRAVVSHIEHASTLPHAHPQKFLKSARTHSLPSRIEQARIHGATLSRVSAKRGKLSAVLHHKSIKIKAGSGVKQRHVRFTGSNVAARLAPITKSFGKALAREQMMSIAKSQTQSRRIEMLFNGEHSKSTGIEAVDLLGNGSLGIACRTISRRRQRAATDLFFDRERVELAAKAGVAESRVKWIGLFRHVPISAVEKLVIDDNAGLLHALLHRGAAAALAQGRGNMQTVNIAMARDTVSGALLQQIIT